MRGQEARVAWLRAHAGASAAEVTDRSPWDWYAESCGCGLPHGGRATWFWTGSRPSTCCWKAATS
jgi:hypothetical protein